MASPANRVARVYPVVIALYLILVVVSAPLALRVEEVMKVAEREILPEDAESRVAGDIVAGELAESLGAADLYVVVSGVDVGYDLYESIEAGYNALSGEYDLYSWIDAVVYARAELEDNLTRAIMESTAFYQGVEALFNAILEASRGVEEIASSRLELARAVGAIDGAYSGAYQELSSLVIAVQGIYPLADNLDAIAFQLSPAYAMLYFDIVRAQGLLEYVGAYEGVLTNETLREVISLSNLSAIGIGPLSPELVVLVHQNVASEGGPGVFNNAYANDLTLRVIEGRAGDAARLYHSVFGGLLAGVDDLRSLVASSPVDGQLEAWRIVAGLESRAARLAALALAETIAAKAPEDVRGLVEAYLEGYVATNFTGRAQAMARAVYSVLAQEIEPLDPVEPLVEDIAEDISMLTLDPAKVALLTASLAGARGAGVPAELLDDIARVVASLDPRGLGILNSSIEFSLRAADRVLVEGLGVPEPVVAEIGEGDTAGAIRALILEEAGLDEEGAALLDALLAGGPPGSLEEAVERSVPLLVKSMLERGVEERLAGAMARAAARVHLGLSTPSEEASSISSQMLPMLVERVVEEVRGLLVEEDLDGFVVLVFGVDSYEDALEAVEAVEGLVRGFDAEVAATGDLIVEREVMEAAVRDLERSDRVSSILVLAILAVLLGSLLGVLLPFASIGVAIATALAILYLLASRDLVDVTSTSRALVFTTGLGLGIDYSAYVARRFRESLREAGSPVEAAAMAIERSWRPVTAGATAAAIGFGSLMLAWDFPFVFALGSNIPIVIVLVALASLTLTPALLALVGARRVMWWPTCPYKAFEPGSRIGGSIGRVVVVLAPIVVLLVAALGAAGAYAFASFEGSHDVRINLPQDSGAARAISIIIEEYDSGALFPAFIVASSGDLASEIASRVSALECISSVRVEGRIVVAGIAYTPYSGEALDCVEDLRAEARRIDPGALVGGASAQSLDLRSLMYQAFYERVLPAAAILIAIVIALFFSSIMAAIAAVAGIALAGLWSIWLSSLASSQLESFQAPWFLPIVVYTAILGVGMDYNSFFLYSAREEYFKGGPSPLMRAVKRASALVVGLALIMASAYAGLMLSSSPALKTIGLALSLGVLLAGINSALLLTPALMSLLGDRFWWPLRKKKNIINKNTAPSPS